MKSNYFVLEIIFLLILSIIPWPGPNIFKISCPRRDANIVRKIIVNKWLPVLDKYRVKIPLECPFHPSRDIFGPQEAAKHQHRPSQWTCGLCGKSFYEERFLDLHFDNRHKNHINMAEDAVCLADFCDIMRCDVIRSQDVSKSSYSESANTDIEIWREKTAYKTELVPTGQRSLSKYVSKSPLNKKGKRNARSSPLCQKKENSPEFDTDTSGTKPEDKSQNNSVNNRMCPNDLVDSALPAPGSKQKRIAERQKFKANCKPEDLQKLKTKCENIVRDCIVGLLIHLSVKDFKEVEDELNRAVCWYLTCERYWEDSQTDIKHFPWGLWFVIFMVLSLGVSLCYYVIWVLFDTDDISVTSTSITDRSTPSPSHLMRQDPCMSSDGQHTVYSEDYFTPDKDNEYIYVTYPPELKRRLIESCYNRTTRL